MSDLSFHLEVYDGPLDLLLGLITKNKLDIYDIPIALILDQYLEYLDQMKAAYQDEINIIRGSMNVQDN